MRPALGQREIALGGFALLATITSLAINHQTRHQSGASATPEGSYAALAGSSGPAAFGRRTACGGTIHPDTEGVSHPTLPCGARVFLFVNGIRVLTQVIDRGPYVPGRQFDLTDALARRVELSGVEKIRWAYARAG
jgi:rare lipoprotein A